LDTQPLNASRISIKNSRIFPSESEARSKGLWREGTGIVVADLHNGNVKKLHAAVRTVNSQWRLRDLAGTGEVRCSCLPAF